MAWPMDVVILLAQMHEMRKLPSNQPRNVLTVDYQYHQPISIRFYTHHFPFMSSCKTILKTFSLKYIHLEAIKTLEMDIRKCFPERDIR